MQGDRPVAAEESESGIELPTRHRRLARLVSRAASIRYPLAAPLRTFSREGQSLAALSLGGPRAAYIGWLGHQNLGDEILFQAHKVLFPDVNLIPYNSVVLEPLCRLSRQRPYQFGILGGGTLIAQHHTWLTAVKHLQDRGIPMICLGTGVASPAFWSQGDQTRSQLKHQPAELLDWVEALSHFEYVGVRGPHSQRILADAGVQTATIVGDTALTLASDSMEADRGVKPGVVGVNVGYVRWDPMWGVPDRFLDEVVKLIQVLCDSGRHVRLLPVWTLDVPSNQEIVRRVDRDRCTLTCAFDNYTDYSNAVSECEVFMGQRLHSTVIACMNRIPSLMVEYRPKCRDFMASLGLEKYVLRTDTFAANSAKTLLDDLFAQAAAVAATMDQRIRRFKTVQAAAATRLAAQLLDSTA